MEIVVSFPSVSSNEGKDGDMNSTSSFSNNVSINGFLVSKATAVLRRWESETKVGFYQTS